MDESALKTFKIKFITLTVILNVVIFLTAAAILTAMLWYMGKIPDIALAAAAAFAIAAFALGVYFKRRFERERSWLEIQNQKEEE